MAARPAFGDARTEPPILSEALRYAALGWPVFPCKPGSKEPATPHGFKDATLDQVKIRAWFEAGDYNMGLAIPAGLSWQPAGRETGDASVY